MRPPRSDEATSISGSCLQDQAILSLLNDETEENKAASVASRPASLVISFFTVTWVTSLLMTAARFTPSIAAQQLYVASLFEVRFCALGGLIFWMCFRGGHPLGVPSLVPWYCLGGMLIGEYVIGPGFIQDGDVGWLTLYRLAIIWFVLQIIRRGFRISLQPARESTAAVPGLNLATILALMSLFAILLFFDNQIRRHTDLLTPNSASLPPLLALVSGFTRSLLWCGWGLVLARGKRSYVLIGCMVLGMWIVSRIGVVLYLDWVHYPQQERQMGGTSSVSIDVLIALQCIQFVLSWVTCMFFWWTGYRMRTATPPHSLSVTATTTSFDSLR